MNIAIVSRKGQIVIPKEIRSKLNIESGDKIMLNIVENHAEIEKVPENVIESLCGILAEHPKSLAEELLKDRHRDKLHENR
jgi:AbrB family looped-hinge helix DNA binding protein